MGDRGHVQFVMDGDEDKSIWLYSHWCGTELPELSRNALFYSRPRWGDPSYATRMMLTNFIGGVPDDTGWGVDVVPGDEGDGGRIVKIDWAGRTVTLITNRSGLSRPMTFEEFVAVENPSWSSGSVVHAALGDDDDLLGD